MPQLGNKPEPFKRGEQELSAESLNKIIGGLLRQIRGGGNTGVSYYGDRVVVSSKDPKVQLPGTGNYLCQVVVLEEFVDYLLCAGFFQPTDDGGISSPQTYDATLNTDSIETIYVAKPYTLQKTPWNGQTVNGSLLTYTTLGHRTSGSTAQAITPAYVAGDLILACKATSGYYDPENDYPIGWMDVNSAGRSWQAAVTSTTPVWGNGVLIGDGVSKDFLLGNTIINNTNIILFVDDIVQSQTLSAPFMSTYNYRVIGSGGGTTIQFVWGTVGGGTAPPLGARIYVFYQNQ